MAKRKVGAPRGKSEEFVEPSSKLTINHYDDVADSEDEFLNKRDKILLDEGPAAKRRRKYEQDDALLEPSDEEVLDYDEDDSLEEDDDDSEVDVQPKKSRSKAKKPSAGSSDDEDDDQAATDDELADEYGDWEGAYYGADDIETEEAALAEETEARRLQQKQLQGMDAADFGFDEDQWLEDKGADVEKEEENTVVELLPTFNVPETASSVERLKLLKTRYPEFEPIAQEFADLQEERESIAKQADLAAQLTVLSGDAAAASHPAVLRHQALTAYLGVMAMYFAVLSSTAGPDGKTTAISPLQLRNHGVMASLLRMRQLWHKVRDLPVPNVEQELRLVQAQKSADTVSRELQNMIDATSAVPVSSSTVARIATKTKPSKAERAAALAQAESAARRADRLAALEADLEGLTVQKTKSSRRKPAANSTTQEDSDLGETAALLPHELAEKAARRKTLQFYTSQIAQKANKRGAAGRDAGGDADVPYKERYKEKQARLKAEEEKRAERGDRPAPVHKDQTPKTKLPTTTPTDSKPSKDAYSDDADSDFYQSISTRKSASKATKTLAAEAYSEASKTGGRVIEAETIGADGKRAITYQIEKNKGLTPHRKKEVRNPRVKKKLKYEEKKKKLSSTRAVYKGGEGRGGYGGELTGIKSGLVKSVRL